MITTPEYKTNGHLLRGIYFGNIDMRVLASYKRATFDFEILDTYTCGIILDGQEVKSCKLGHPNISDGIIKFYDMKLSVSNIDIPIFKHTNPNLVPGYQPRGRRRLLMKKSELSKLREKTHKGGLSIIPLQMVESTGKRIKLVIALAKRKANYDKKNTIKDRDTERLQRQRLID